MSIRSRSLAAVIAAVVYGSFMSANDAQASITGATYQLYVDDSVPSPHSAPGVYTGTYNNGQASFTNTGAASTSPALSISGSATGINVTTSVELVYFFEVINSASTAVAPVNLTLSAILSGAASIPTSSSIAYGDGEIDIPQVISGIPALTTFCGGVNEGGGCASSTQTITYNNAPFTINANQVNEVYMTLQGGTATAGGTYSAMIDPVISINPNQPNAGNYSIVFSQGIQNTAVPLPGSIWLLLSGLCGLKIMTRGRTRTSVEIGC